MCWNDRLTPIASKAAPDPVYVKRWTATTTLYGAEPRLSLRRLGVNPCEIAGLVKRERSKSSAIVWGELYNIVIEAGHGHVTVLVV